MLIRTFFLLAVLSLAAALPNTGCEAEQRAGDGDSDSDGDTDTDTDTDTDSDTDTETSTQYDGPSIPETCEQAAQATTTVGCLFYGVDLDVWDMPETVPYAIVVSNVNQTETANVIVSQGNATTSSFDSIDAADVAPMSLHTFNLPDYHMDTSGLMPKGSFKVESDVPIVAYQFNPLDGASSFTSDASMLIPATSLSETYDVVGWKQITTMLSHQMYFDVVAVSDGTEVTITPSVAPCPGGVVPGSIAPFTVSMDEGDVLEVQTANENDSLTGTRIASNPGHPIAVFSAHECATIPTPACCCDHLEEQIPGLRFWGTSFVASRMPVRNTSGNAEGVLWQIYASEDDTQVMLSASTAVTGLPFANTTMNQGQTIEFYAGGTLAEPGDFYVEANKPIGVFQYMTGSESPDVSYPIGDPCMVYVSPTEQFLPRYVVLAPGTWINDMLIVTRTAGVEVLLDGTPIPDGEFMAVTDSGFEVARKTITDGVHTLESPNESYGLGVIVVGWDEYDSYAYTGGMGLAAINPIVE